MRIAIGADHRGFEMRLKLIELVRRFGHEVEDTGVFVKEHVDYPDIAEKVAQLVSSGQVDRGILAARLGIGMVIVANKFPGVRAAACQDELTAESSRRHNDANILCVSADLLGDQQVERVLEVWLDTPFDGGRHQRRLDKIVKVEEATMFPRAPRPA